jgi:hypothetical protein
MTHWHDAYLSQEIDEARRLVRQVRSAVDFPSIGALEESISQLAAQLTPLRRGDYVLFQDMRAARGRNDPAFEAAMAKHRRRLSEGFRRVAVLVTSQVGRLQVQRYLEQDEIPGRAFLDEAEALRWLEE